MKKLLIIGAGGLGREVLSWALDIPSRDRDWEVGGFLDANARALNGYETKYNILADPMTYLPAKGDCFVCAIGNPVEKLRVCNSLSKNGAEFITLRHPSAVIGRRCLIGIGCIFCPGAVVTTDVTVGDFVTVNAQATIGHDAYVGKGSTLCGHVDITGFASIGEGVFLGSHAVVLPQAQVGDYSIVGAGSVVLKKVQSGVTVMGVPAKQIAGF